MEVVRAWLKENGKTQRWLAGELGVSEPSVSQWRRVPDAHLVRVRELTGIHGRELRPEIADAFK